MDIMSAVQDACVSGQWITAIILSICCFLPSCLPAGQTVDYASSESVTVDKNMTMYLKNSGLGCASLSHSSAERSVLLLFPVPLISARRLVVCDKRASEAQAPDYPLFCVATQVFLWQRRSA
ncbi:hypothetical protein Baya_4545 [Bagarius yarrelli]|uniref:Uncharacterized protein n=1 Tax=Bagarius yarrelli TaxID=175774 RepID=A0A556TR28_BAGYA|nr:hypothetical protein Baya_4545 [Bagarius yarrelli]